MKHPFRPGSRRAFCSSAGSATMVLVTCALLVGCLTGPPKDRTAERPSDLVELVAIEPGLRLDIRYATTNNFLGRPVYQQPRAFLQRPAAEALARAHRQLAPLGYGLLVFDGYRPWSVTQAFWKAATPEQRRIGFVADPRAGSKHNRGCAVDLSLFELATGLEVTMPSGYDEFTERAAPNYLGGTPETRQLRDLLRRTMESEGFTVLPEEWWHFDYRDWQRYPILDVPFEDLNP